MATPYEGRLAPVDVRNEFASEVREFRVDIDGSVTEWDDVLDAVRDQVIDTGVVGRWAFKNHWEISTLAQVNATREQQLRDVVRSTRHTVPTDGDREPVEFHVYDTRADCWDTTTLQIGSTLSQEFFDWQSSINNRNIATFCSDPGHLHEAAVRGAVDVCPSLVGEFAAEPLLATTRMFRIALNNKDTVADHLNEITI